MLTRGLLSLLLLIVPLLAHANPPADAVILAGTIEPGMRVTLDLTYDTTSPYCWELKTPFSLPVQAYQKRRFIPVIHDGGRYEMRVPLHREGNWISRAYEKLCRFIPDGGVITVSYANAREVKVVHKINVAFPQAIAHGFVKEWTDFADFHEVRYAPRVESAANLEPAESSVGVRPDAFASNSTVTWKLDFLTER